MEVLIEFLRLRKRKEDWTLVYDMNKSRDFQECVDGVELREVVFYGNPFTWWNGRQEDQAIWKRLDRGFVSDGWDGMLKTYMQHLGKASSDHSPLIMCIELQIKMGKRPFGFINALGEHEQFLKVVKRAWEVRIEGNTMYKFVSKLKSVKQALKKWSWEGFGDIFAKVEELEE